MKKSFRAFVSVFLAMIIVNTCTIFIGADYARDERNKKIDSVLNEKLLTVEDKIPITIWTKPADISFAETAALKKLDCQKRISTQYGTQT